MRNSTFLLYILVQIIGLYGVQAQNACRRIDNVQFQTVVGQLSENMVTDIVQDDKGFIWVGTRDGLNRYNGIEFTVYEHAKDDTSSLSSSFIFSLLIDDDGVLWVGTNNGLNRYKENNDNFERFKFLSVFRDKVVRVLFQDSKGNIWIGTDRNGLFCYNKSNGLFEWYRHDKNKSGSLSSDNIKTVNEDSNGNILVGTGGKGLNVFDGNAFEHYNYDGKDPFSINSDYIKTSFRDNDGNLWIGTKTGLNKVTEKHNTLYFENIEIDVPDELDNVVPNVITDIEQDCSGNIWVAIENKGLVVYNTLKNSYTNFHIDPLNPNSLPANSIWKIFRDETCTMWLAPRNQGLVKWDKYQSRFNHQKMITPGTSLNNNDVTCFAEDKDKNLWIGTDGGGLTFINRKTNEIKRYHYQPGDPGSLGSNAVISLEIDKYNRLWVGTWEGGLNLFNASTGKFKRFMHDPDTPGSISSNNIYQIYEDSKDRLWISAYGVGLDIYDDQTGEFQHIVPGNINPDKSNSDDVIEISEDSEGTIWLGTACGGLSMAYEDESGDIIVKSFSHGLYYDILTGNSRVNIIKEDSKKRLWVGTFGGGLSCLNCKDSGIVNYRKSDGLPSNVISGILESDDGDLWISTSNGITKFDPESVDFDNYYQSDGLQSNEFLPGACLKTFNGEMFFGGTNGFNSFFPDNIIKNPNLPPVFITNFRIFSESVKPEKQGSPLNKLITNTSSINLKHNQNVFSFEFSALNYTEASKNQYAYMLEGYDKGWQYCGTRRNAYYTKVPPGTYTFRVRASNNDGYWNNEGRALSVIVNPPWYGTAWAYVVYISFGVFLFIWYRHMLIKRERLKSDLKLEHMELVKMQELDQAKSDFFANISHELRTPLTLILGPLKSLQQNIATKEYSGQLSLMVRNAEMLLKLINQLLDISKLGAGKMKLDTSRSDIVAFIKPILYSFETAAENNHIKLFINAEMQKQKVYFDHDKLEKVMINLISNALKFTPEYGTVHVNISRKSIGDIPFDSQSKHGYVVIQVKDSGIGIPEEHLTAIFERFYQVKNGRKEKNIGTGIGLSLTRQLVELHKGQILVSSKINKGTCFDVYLPLGRDHLKDDEIVYKTAGNRSVGKTMMRASVSLSEYNGKSLNTGLSKNEDESTGQPKILIVEDNHDIRQYISNQLQDKYQVIEAVDGNTGYAAAQDIDPDLIVMDVMMPGMNGYELCEKLKQEDRTSHIPILLLTAKASESSQTKGLECGADYYMAKPFDTKIFDLNINNIINSRKAIKQKYAPKTQLTAEPGKIYIDSAEEQFFKQAVASVEKNISRSNFTVNDLAKDLGTSRMQLYRKLKSLSGSSANEFIRDIKLKRAAQLLESGQFTVTQVMYNVGFNDVYYFRSCFKKKYGVTPSKYTGKPSSKS